MNDAILTISPAQTNETVGNSPKVAKLVGRVQILKRDDDFALGRMWSSFTHQASRDVANPSKPLTNPQISLYGSYFGTLIPNAESGEGVVSSGDVVQELSYYPYGSSRVDQSMD